MKYAHIPPDILGDERVLFDLPYPQVLDENGKPRIRVLFVLSGGKAGIVSAKRMTVFSEYGIPIEHFDLVIAISIGMYIALACGADLTHVLEEMFLQYVSLPIHVRNSVQCMVTEIQRHVSPEALDKFRASKTEFRFALSNYWRRLSLCDPKKVKNIFDVLYAGSSIPPAAFGRRINGHWSYDGAFAKVCPTNEAARMVIKKWGTRRSIDILFLFNRPRPKFLPRLDPIIYALGVNLGLFPIAPLLAIGANKVDGQIHRIATALESRPADSRVRICAWFPNRSQYIPPVSFDAKSTMIRVGESVRNETMKYFDALRPKIVV